MPILAESGPLTFGGNDVPGTPPQVVIPPETPTPSPYTQPTATAAEFTLRHREFINQVNTLGSCFRKEQIKNFTSEDFDQHILVAEIDKYVSKLKNQDGVYCTEQSVRDINKTLQRYYD
uniref:Uncharacterized protein n=1 Tax=viral metagenome TaxID=1070528 RepID=A0A6M3Y7B8_9ZZZZ